MDTVIMRIVWLCDLHHGPQWRQRLSHRSRMAAPQACRSGPNTIWLKIIAALNTLHRVARGFLVRRRLLSICEERVFIVDDADAAAFVMSGH
eukprot:4445100-Prymnesium_polylepis.2